MVSASKFRKIWETSGNLQEWGCIQENGGLLGISWGCDWDCKWMATTLKEHIPNSSDSEKDTEIDNYILIKQNLGDFVGNRVFRSMGFLSFHLPRAGGKPCEVAANRNTNKFFDDWPCFNHESSTNHPFMPQSSVVNIYVTLSIRVAWETPSIVAPNGRLPIGIIGNIWGRWIRLAPNRSLLTTRYIHQMMDSWKYG